MSFEIKSLKKGGPAREEMHKILDTHTRIFNGHGENQRADVLPLKNALTGIIERVSYLYPQDYKVTLKSCPGHTRGRPGEDPITQRSPHFHIKFGPGPNRQRYVWDRNTGFPLSR